MAVRWVPDPRPTAPASKTIDPGLNLGPDLDLDALPPPAAGPSPRDHPIGAPEPEPEPEPPYLPRSLLSRGPSPQQAIDLPYPDLAPIGRFRAVLTLFIDEHGVVQRVRLDEADDTGLPPLLADAARQTFLQSAFTPGEVEGRPVRSQLRIEVEFATEDPAQTSASTRR